MTQQAQVTSVEAIESFRASLVVYLSKARAAMDEVGAEVMRMRGWLQLEQRRKWEQELKIRRRRLEEAQNELFTARLSSLHQAGALQFMAVQRAERSVQEAEERLAAIKKWERTMDDITDPLIRQADQLHGYLATDMGKAVLHLDQIIQSLDAYARVQAPEPAPRGPQT